MQGRSPATGRRLAEPTESTKIVALDLTFSAPKSVTVRFAIGDAEMKSQLISGLERNAGPVELQEVVGRRDRAPFRPASG